MKGLASATSVVITVLTTLLISAVAYGASTGLPHRTGETHPFPPASPKPSPEPSPTSPAIELPTPVPTTAGMYVLDEDMADASTGWVLLTDCDTQSTCRYAVSRTPDAGHSWTRPAQVGPAFLSVNGDAPRTIRFANKSDGFVYGHAEAYVTHDGGASWQELGVPAVFFSSVAINGDSVWLTTYPCPKGTSCQFEVRSSLDGGRSWSARHQLPAGFSPESPVAFSTGVIMTDVPFGNIQITSNSGATWRSIKSACTGNPFRGFATTADGHDLWERCEGYPNSAGVANNVSLFVSTDGGMTWSRRTPPPVAPPIAAESIVTTRPLVAFAAGANRSVVTRDGGKTWSDISNLGVVFTLLRFGADWGWALDTDRVVWQTYDGGDQWTEAGSFPIRL